MDGTFSTAPPMFRQVFIIQAFIHGICVPVVYALLPDKRTLTYVHLFNVLSDTARRMNKTFEPSLIMTDFESGLTKGISLEFSSKTIQKGCFFHYCQAIYRQVQSLGLSTMYLEDLPIRSVIRQMMALALVPVEYVQQLFSDLVEAMNTDDHQTLSSLFTYFEKQWIKQIPNWNVYDILDRTNNYSEGYNNRFKRRLQAHHPNIWRFIDAIQKEVDTVHSMINQINSGMPMRMKKTKSRISERRMKELYDRFHEKRMTIEDLLRGLSFFVAHKK